MKIIDAIVTGGKDDFGIWLEHIDGMSGAGKTLEEAKASLIEAIEIYKEISDNIPEGLKGEYEINYIFDISGFLKYYSKYISFAALKDITGIHQKQLWNYANGYRKPSKETAMKIRKAIGTFIESMNEVQFRF